MFICVGKWLSNISGFDPVLGASWAGGGRGEHQYRGSQRYWSWQQLHTSWTRHCWWGKKTQKTQLNQIHEMTWKGKSYCCNESEFARKDEWCSLSGWVQAADATSTLASQRPSWGWKSDHTPKSDRPKIRLLFTLCAHHTHFNVKIWKDHLPKPLHCSQVPQPTCSRYMSAGEPDYCIVAIWKLGQEQKWRSSYFSPTHKSKWRGFLFCVYAWTSRTLRPIVISNPKDWQRTKSNQP